VSTWTRFLPCHLKKHLSAYFSVEPRNRGAHCITVFKTNTKRDAANEQQQRGNIMSRRHFAKIAEIIARIEDEQERKRVAHEMAEVCRSENSRFDSARFYSACKI
jgi:hypothetical protein